jgi:hypothetical protein
MVRRAETRNDPGNSGHEWHRALLWAKADVNADALVKAIAADFVTS